MFVRSATLVPLVLLGLAVAACGGENNDTPTLKCGAGTQEMSGECVATGMTVVCGAGTFRRDTMCLPDTSLQCGAGTRRDGDNCVPTDHLACGAGTMRDGDACVLSGVPITCGPGTVEHMGVCVVGELYEIRLAVTEIPGDGYSTVPIFLIGRNADGTPSTEEVVISTSVPGAGSFDRVRVRLGSGGTNVYFTPCSIAASAGCAGPFQFVLAKGSTPTAPIAMSVVVTIVEPMGVGTPAPCLIGGNVIFYDGDPGDYIFPRQTTITDGMFSAQASPNFVSVHVDPSMTATQGLWWDLEFSSQQIGQPLMEQTYENAERYPFEGANRPGLSIGGDGRGCNMLSGRFQIHELQLSGMTLVGFTATFEQHCENGTAALRGCVHFE